MGIKKEALSHHSVEKIKSDKVRQVSSVVPDRRHPAQSSYPSGAQPSISSSLTFFIGKYK